MASHPTRLPFLGSLLIILCSVWQGQTGSDGTEYLLVSQPKLGNVVYYVVHTLTRKADHEAHSLVSGLQQPFGLAVDQKRFRLFVADARSKKVFMYRLNYDNGELTTDGDQYVAMSGLTPRWVAVDEFGTVFCTDENQNLIAKVTSDELEKEHSQMKVAYSGNSLKSVSRPAGIAVDGFHLFWANKDNGNVRGSLVEALEKPFKKVPGKTGVVAVLGRNPNRVYGVCASRTNVFFTGENRFLFAAKKIPKKPWQGKQIAVEDNLVAPRGCAWDGDGSVYVADKGGNAIWVVPAAMGTLEPHADEEKLLEVTNPYGLAVFRPPEAIGNVQNSATSKMLAWTVLLSCAVMGGS
eukprot:gnl/TRDRNA2_/TRDRNA2_179950_c0_seq1.p1 gnl/TRDRNA2_/TRDRNA2_179950_c0~~gnl/TRDRNA2_/TRDRNA2_179950_c0_seq1.p1  ORF type:complete len:351 (+),score=64.26 gnl/TRDRNA2_/TRDRNA2_179950_c0_seq1:98-1150(+)